MSMSSPRKSSKKLTSNNTNSAANKPPAANSPAANLPRPNTKRTGERSEAAFLARALHLEFAIAKPWGDSQRYDFILDNGTRLWRIQTKCTEGLRADAYETRATYTVGKKRAVYTRADIDFIAAHVVPLDIWYIIPVEVCTPAPMLRMYPHRKAKKMRLENYRNAWFLLKLMESPEDGPITIEANADETYENDKRGREEGGRKQRSADAPVRNNRDIYILVAITETNSNQICPGKGRGFKPQRNVGYQNQKGTTSALS